MKIFYLLGKSASGKDTIFNMLINDSELNLERLIPCTTRPKRANEVDGVDYYFYTVDEFKKMQSDDQIIESRTYNTENGQWIYFTKKQSLDSNYITIGTIDSYLNIRNIYADDIIPIYLYLDDGIRLQRALVREQEELNPKYAEMCRRFLADIDDFSEEKLCNANINIRIENISTQKTYQEVKNVIIKAL